MVFLKEKNVEVDVLLPEFVRNRWERPDMFPEPESTHGTPFELCLTTDWGLELVLPDVRAATFRSPKTLSSYTIEHQAENPEQSSLIQTKAQLKWPLYIPPEAISWSDVSQTIDTFLQNAIQERAIINNFLPPARGGPNARKALEIAFRYFRGENPDSRILTCAIRLIGLRVLMKQTFEIEISRVKDVNARLFEPHDPNIIEEALRKKNDITPKFINRRLKKAITELIADELKQFEVSLERLAETSQSEHLATLVIMRLLVSECQVKLFESTPVWDREFKTGGEYQRQAREAIRSMEALMTGYTKGFQISSHNELYMELKDLAKPDLEAPLWQLDIIPIEKVDDDMRRFIHRHLATLRTEKI